MSGRIEHKYLVPNRFLERLRADLAPYVEEDEFAGKQASGDYTVRSVYYDSRHLDCYDEKIEGLGARKKFRIRGYNECTSDSVVFLEIKDKWDSFIAKSRAPLYYRDVDAMLEFPDIEQSVLSFKGNGEKERSDAERFIHHYYRLGLRPTVLVVYDREAFFGKFDTSLRLTFDKNLRTSLFPSLDGLFDDQDLMFAMPKHFIFEVKFFRRALPAWVTSIVRRYAIPRMALSKFTICLDARKVPRRTVQMGSRAFSAVWKSDGNGGEGVASRPRPWQLRRRI